MRGEGGGENVYNTYQKEGDLCVRGGGVILIISVEPKNN